MLEIAKKGSSGATIFDQTALIFDFTAVTGAVEFKYLFASEEYPAWANSDYNDAFGFIIWEMDPSTNKPIESTKRNIAILPKLDASGKIIPVSINTVNNGKGDISNVDYNSLCFTTPPSGFASPQNYEYFQPIPLKTAVNDALCSDKKDFRKAMMSSIEFNGRTVELVAKADLKPCKKYRMKLIIGNTSDANYGSAVFLAANSFDLGEPVQNIIPLINGGTAVSNTVYKGHTGTFKLDKGYTENVAKDFIFKLEGTLQTNGRITITAGVPMTKQQVINFAANKAVVNLPYKITNSAVDGESLVATFVGECEITTSKMTLRVVDPELLEINAIPTPAILCSPTDRTARIDVTVTNGAGFYKYRLLKKVKTGTTETETVERAWQDEDIFENLGSGNYIVEVQDLAYTIVPEGKSNIKRVSVRILDTTQLENVSPILLEDCSGLFEIDATNSYTTGVGKWVVSTGGVTFGNTTSVKTTVQLNKKIDEAKIYWQTNVPTCGQVNLPVITLRRAGTADLTAYKNIYKTVSRSATTDAVLDLSADLESDVKADSKWLKTVAVKNAVSITADGKVNKSALTKDGTYVFQFESDVPCAGRVTRYYYLTITE